MLGIMYGITLVSNKFKKPKLISFQMILIKKQLKSLILLEPEV